MKKNSTYICKECWAKRSRKYFKDNPESRKKSDVKWREKAGNKISKDYWLSHRENVHYVYSIGDYVGVTRNIYYRKHHHKSVYNRDISKFKILHTYNNREEALAKEAEYHNMGYAGAKLK